jgi:5-methylcytosine-specific restriction endonuclease McrA
MSAHCSIKREIGEGVKMKYYRYCHAWADHQTEGTDQKYPVELHSVDRYCPIHKPKYFANDVRAWLHARRIMWSFFDLYVDNNGHEEEVCRNCGNFLRTKKGKYSPRKRYCSVKCSDEFQRNYTFDWSTRQWQYKHQLAEKKCELCGKSGELQVHHKIPVINLNETNFQLCWDFQNLIALCHQCHHNFHAKGWLAHQSDKPNQIKYQTLLKYIQRGSV